MLSWIDKFLNKITMYRLTLYYLLVLIIFGGIFSLFGLMPFRFWPFFFSFWFVLLVAWIFNKVFSWGFNVPANTESFYITAFILTLIISPAVTKTGYGFLLWATIIAIASKYIIAINRKHIFNPAAFAVVATVYTIGLGASWWVGNAWMLVPVVLGGILVVRKIRRWNMVFAFLITTLIVTVGFGLLKGSDTMLILKEELIYSPLFFFAFVMFTEPSSTPPTNTLQVIYGIIVGVLFSPFVHFGGFYLTPEEALLLGNIYSFIVSPKQRLLLTLKEKKSIGADLYDFIFTTDKKFSFNPGQYLEWTLGHAKADLRGNRRYFTISSSPTEDTVRMGVKFYEPSSTFKKALLSLKPGDKLLAGQLAGDFTLPTDPQKKLAFLAGGIGITPYRSMIKYLIDKNEKRPVTLFFSNKTKDEIVYEDIFTQAREKLGIKTVYTLTDDPTPDWKGERGRLNRDIIAKHLPDFAEHTFYISGTHAMVDAMESMLKNAGIPGKQIKTDFFPGFV